jgi:PmbA protein
MIPVHSASGNSGSAEVPTLQKTVERLLDMASDRDVTGAEVYGERSLSRRIKVYQGGVEQLTEARRTGVGLRVLSNGSMGYAYSSDTGDKALAQLVDRAVAHASVTQPDEHAVLPQPQMGAVTDLVLFSENLGRVSQAEKIDTAIRCERAALGYDPRVKLVEDTIYVDEDAEVVVASTTGIRGAYRVNHSYLFLYVLAEQDGGVETGVAYDVGRDPALLDPVACGREAAERACRLLGARPCPSFKGTVVLEPYTAAAVIGVLGSALTADAVQKGRSLFASLEGQAVAAELLDLADDGIHPEGLASAPFDGEGVPCRRTPIISGGTLQGFLYDTYTAHKAGRASTGNGGRGSYQSAPSVRPTNMVLGGRVTPVADVIAGIERGVLVTDVVGVHSGANPVSGEFSVGISGILIESGRLGRPLREVTLAGDIPGMLRGVVALGDDARWVPSGSVLTPTVAIEGMSVAGS